MSPVYFISFFFSLSLSVFIHWLPTFGFCELIPMVVVHHFLFALDSFHIVYSMSSSFLYVLLTLLILLLVI